MKKILLLFLLFYSISFLAQVPPGYTKDRSNEDATADPEFGGGTGSGTGSYRGDENVMVIPEGDLDRRSNAKFSVFSENKLEGIRSNKDNSVVLKPEYNKIYPYSGYYLLEKDKKMGLYNPKTQKVTIPVAYDSVKESSFSLKHEIIGLKNKHGWGALSVEGKEIMPFKFFKIKYLNNDGVALAQKTVKSSVELYFNGKTLGKEITTADIYNNGTIATTKGKKGMISNGKEVLPFVYDSIYIGGIVNGGYRNKPLKRKEPYMTNFQDITNLIVIKDKKYGIADVAGNLVVPVQFDNIIYDNVRKFYKLKSGKQTGIYFTESKVKTDIVYDEITSSGIRLILVKDNKRGAMDYKGNIVAPVIYDKISENGSKLMVTKDGFEGVIDLDGKVIIPLEYDEVEYFGWYFNGLYKVEKEKKKGVVDAGNKIIVPLLYENIGEENKLIKVMTEDKKFGLYTPTGELVAPVVYDRIKNSETKRSSLLVLRKNGKYTVMGTDHKLQYEDQFTHLDYLYDKDGLINPNFIATPYRVVKKDTGKYGILNEKTVALTVPVVYDGLYQKLEWDSKTYIVAKKAGKFGVIDGSDTEVLPFVYDSINFNRVGLHYATLETITVVARKGKKYGVVNFKNQEKIPFVYDELVRLAEQPVYKAKVKGKYIYITLNGKVRNPGPFDEIAPFENNNSYVFKADKMYSMNLEGDVSGVGIPMKPHIGFATFDEMKWALVKALESKDNSLLKAWVDKAAPSEYILKFFKDSDLYKREGVTMDAEYIKQKYYADLLKFKMQEWNSEYYHKESLTLIKDYTLWQGSYVTNVRNEDWAFGDTRFMEKVLRSAIKINGWWISTYFLAKRFE